ncbi:MAG TPA: M56 family metallopeptidase [Ilumatobacter sp.]|nr:M56 family metallopeptidase [Ilumatobacter sp.]
MFALVVVPLVVAVVLATVMTAVHRRLPPALASKVVTITLGAVVVAAVPTVWVVALGYVTHISILGGWFEWCAKAFGVHAPVFGGHEPVPAWAGVPAVALTVFGLVRMRAVVRSYRRLRHDGCASVEVAEHAEPFAYTLPGRGGRVVVSSGLVELLDDDEREVVLAHERAHGRHRHDRYLLVAQLAAAVVPFARPLAARLRFSLERWADEHAAAACGDRRFVAHTLGKVALHRSSGVSPAGALGFGGLGVPARVAALLAPASTAPRSVEAAAIWSAIAVIGGLAILQIHHLEVVVRALCPW